MLYIEKSRGPRKQERAVRRRGEHRVRGCEVCYWENKQTLRRPGN